MAKYDWPTIFRWSNFVHCNLLSCNQTECSRHSEVVILQYYTLDGNTYVHYIPYNIFLISYIFSPIQTQDYKVLDICFLFYPCFSFSLALSFALSFFLLLSVSLCFVFSLSISFCPVLSFSLFLSVLLSVSLYFSLSFSLLSLSHVGKHVLSWQWHALSANIFLLNCWIETGTLKVTELVTPRASKVSYSRAIWLCMEYLGGWTYCYSDLYWSVCVLCHDFVICHLYLQLFIFVYLNRFVCLILVFTKIKLSRELNIYDKMSACWIKKCNFSNIFFTINNELKVIYPFINCYFSIAGLFL